MVGLGKRELAFFPGSAVGPCLGPYEAGTQKTGLVPELALLRSELHGVEEAGAETITPATELPKTLRVFYNGGSTFTQTDGKEPVGVIAHYTSSHCTDVATAGQSAPPPAILSLTAGLGSVILSGVHPEIRPAFFRRLLDQNPEREDAQHIRENILPGLELDGGRSSGLLLAWMFEKLLANHSSTPQDQAASGLLTKL
eukprot:TRINITY_DN34981_c0_g1_i2.p1 TRINITY_DN34981_c0_g1~~TRINITY_DN34981_c0_g1_i2.p1  ORF type:complete len:198 (-),score=15.59 TRINITY_DN34981_c0_g1_i2:437-1030(-)